MSAVSSLLRPVVVLGLACASVATLVACSSAPPREVERTEPVKEQPVSAPESVPQPGQVAPAPAAETSHAGPSPRSADCLALDAKLQAALNAARKKSPCREYALAVETVSCPLTSYVSSDDANAKTDQTYRVASNTKMLTASVILKLVAAGKLGLDDLVTKHLPGTAGLSGMTVRQVLNHSAGLYDYSEDEDFDDARQSNPKRKWKPTELLSYATKHAPTFKPPGSSYAYSNTGFIVAGMVAEKVGGKKISELIRELLLVPQDLPDMYFDTEEAPRGTLARGDDTSGNDVSTKFDESWIWSAGATIATTKDLARWTQRLGSGAVHAPAMQAELEKGVSMGSAGASYGLGVFIYGANYGYGGGRMIGHSGVLIGYYSRSFYFPDTKTTVTTVVTCPKGSSEDARIAALGAIFPNAK
jgi:D-alanyl-D-alanine carboxypeptidase